MLMDTNGHIYLCEDYVSFETAKLLKEKGFEDKCDYIYKNKLLQFDDTTYYYGGVKLIDRRDNEEIIPAPSQSLALKWLREVYDLHIIVYPWQADNEEKAIHWCCTVYKAFAHLGNDVYTNETPKSYEEAIETALLYVLKNLI